MDLTLEVHYFSELQIVTQRILSSVGVSAQLRLNGSNRIVFNGHRWKIRSVFSNVRRPGFKKFRK